jgi:hypothetical protein
VNEDTNRSKKVDETFGFGTGDPDEFQLPQLVDQVEDISVVESDNIFRELQRKKKIPVNSTMYGSRSNHSMDNISQVSGHSHDKYLSPKEQINSQPKIFPDISENLSVLGKARKSLVDYPKTDIKITPIEFGENGRNSSQSVIGGRPRLPLLPMMYTTQYMQFTNLLS